MTLDEMKNKSSMLRERTDKADALLSEIDRMRRLDIAQAKSVSMSGGCLSSVVCDDLLQDVLRRGINAAIEWREIEILKLLDVSTKCESCHGPGTPPGEAAGLVCGNCMGSGIEPEETPD